MAYLWSLQALDTTKQYFYSIFVSPYTQKQIYRLGNVRAGYVLYRALVHYGLLIQSHNILLSISTTMLIALVANTVTVTVSCSILYIIEWSYKLIYTVRNNRATAQLISVAMIELAWVHDHETKVHGSYNNAYMYCMTCYYNI